MTTPTSTSTTSTGPVAASGTFTLGSTDGLTVHRLGFGAMRIVGKGVWGEPADRETARQVVRRAVELGVDFIDTADSYGPFISEDVIREAIHPYGDVVVATKGGLLRTGPDVWPVCGRPDYLRQCVEMSLRRLGVERIDLWQLHRIDPEVPADEQFGVMKELQDAGKLRHLGLSEVSVEEIEQARKTIEVVSVQNLYNLGNRQSEAVLEHCEKEGIGFIPWFPLDAGKLSKEGSVLDEIAKEHEATHSQLALAWLLKRSPVMLPIPGTGSVAHLEENCAGAEVTLTDEEFTRLSDAGK